MNRLVIVGNGFDLAHGLPTGYRDFIKWYWTNLVSNITFLDDNPYGRHVYDDDILRITFKFFIDYKEDRKNIQKELMSLTTYEELKKFVSKYSADHESKLILKHSPDYNVNDCKLEIKNTFFIYINKVNSINTWVDIENEYYKLLKDCLEKNDDNKVKQLNSDFESIKQLLNEYLLSFIEQKYSLEKNSEIVNILGQNDYWGENLQRFYEELQTNEAINLRINNFNSLQIKQTMIISFNYTSLSHIYANMYSDDIIVCKIHGSLSDINNPIIFGFGDEMDDAYKIIENRDNNEYLKYIKSFSYLNTPNYKKAIGFLESDKYQVYIMGHSCGLSDRILLNKIFEHRNCISIKIFYYKNDKSDNYTDLAQNISRHFNKKEMMRERIVNKTFCTPLPQMQLPLK